MDRLTISSIRRDGQFVKGSHRILFARRLDARNHAFVFHSDIDHHRHRVQARVALTKLAGSERIAQQWERLTCDHLRASVARAYRRLIGVNPDQRQVLRAALEQVRLDGRRSVADVLSDFGGQSQNPSSTG